MIVADCCSYVRQLCVLTLALSDRQPIVRMNEPRENNFTALASARAYFSTQASPTASLADSQPVWLLHSTPLTVGYLVR
jgi:hypothetical protein